MSKTECVLKISNHAEPFYTTFDTETGIMSGLNRSIM